MQNRGSDTERNELRVPTATLSGQVWILNTGVLTEVFNLQLEDRLQGWPSLNLVKNDSSPFPADVCAVICTSSGMFLLLKFITTFPNWWRECFHFKSMLYTALLQIRQTCSWLEVNDVNSKINTNHVRNDSYVHVRRFDQKISFGYYWNIWKTCLTITKNSLQICF